MTFEFELGIILVTILVLIVLGKSNKKILRRFWLALIAVFLFEYFTQPLWINAGLVKWAYLYLDVSWILTLAWVNLILISMAIIGYLVPKFSEMKRFLLSIGLVTIFGLYWEWVLIRLDIRKYPVAIKALLDTTYRIGGVVPLIELIYIPTFMALVFAFIKYWELSFDSVRIEKKVKRGKKK